MSIPSFSSFPQRNPKPTPPPPTSSFPTRPALQDGNDESSRPGPSFSSFPVRPPKDDGVEGDHAQEREKSRNAREEADTYKKDKRRKDKDLREDLEEVQDRARNPDGQLRRRRDRVDESLLAYRVENQLPMARSGKDKERRRSRSRDRDRHRHRKRSHSPDRYREGKRSHNRDRTQPKAQPSPAPEPTKPDPKEFYTDTKGDQDILHFGPQRGIRYVPIGKGRVVGLSDAYRLDLRDVGGGRGVAVMLRSDSTDANARGSLLLPLSGPSLRLRYNQGSSKQIDEQRDFISIGKPKKRKVVEQVKDRVEAYWEEEDRKGRLDKVLESSSGSEQENEDEEEVDMDVELEETEEDRRRRKIIEFERTLKDSPGDVDSWIAYSQLHLSGSSSSSSSSSASKDKKGKKSRPEQISTAKQGEAEIATEILSKAFRAHESNKSDPRLHSAFFKLVQLFWPAERVTASWKAVLRELTERTIKGDEPGLMDLWLEFIAWREGRGLGSHKGREGSMGGVDDVVDVYVECVEVMNSAKKSGGDNVRFLEENLVYLLLRCCLLLKHAGYIERTTAAIQAMLELTFFKPAHLRRSLFQDPREWEDRLIQDLENFWDSEHARVGEASAHGWCDWKRDEEPDFDALAGDATQGEQRSSQASDPYTRWFQDEESAERRRSRPARALDLAEDDEDPFRTILFADVQPLLFVIQDPEVKLQFAFAAMNLLGVPLVPPGVGSDSPFYTDPHLSWSLDVNTARLWPARTLGDDSLAIVDKLGSTRGSRGVFDCPLKAWAADHETLCGDIQPWFSTLDKDFTAQCDLALVSNILKQLQSVVLEPAFKTAYLAIESLRSRKGATTAAKMLIASDQRNLQLYASYARILRQQNKVKEARQVYAMCLQTMTSDAETADTEVRRQLLLEWALMEHLAGEGQKSLNVLVLVAGGSERVDVEHLDRAPTGVAILKARNAFTKVDLNDLEWTKLRYLFRVQQEPFERVFQDLQLDVQFLPSNTPQQEQLGQFACQLAWTQKQRNYIAPTVLRPFLEGLIAVYPNNTIFLSLYLANESSSQVFGRVHRTIEDTILNSSESSATAFLWAAWAEARSGRGEFWSPSSAAAERVRHVFDKALDVAGSARRSLAIWKAYIEFEAVQGRSDAAKQLCYRALGEIGTAKGKSRFEVLRLFSSRSSHGIYPAELYMLPFSPTLRPFFTEKELQDWSEVMVEKGIRIRLPFEQYWRSVDTVDYLDRDDGGDPMKEEDRVFDFLQERKELMPY